MRALKFAGKQCQATQFLVQDVDTASACSPSDHRWQCIHPHSFILVIPMGSHSQHASFSLVKKKMFFLQAFHLLNQTKHMQICSLQTCLFLGASLQDFSIHNTLSYLLQATGITRNHFIKVNGTELVILHNPVLSIATFTYLPFVHKLSSSLYSNFRA